MIKLVNKNFKKFLKLKGFFNEFGKILYSPVYQKHVFLEIYKKSNLPTEIWRAAVFWPCKGSIIISLLIEGLYEWLNEV